MPDLTGRGPLGPKTGKTSPKPPKPVRKVSAKRAAYMASPERKAALIHMARVKLLPCICCGAPAPSDAHHCRSGGIARNDMATIPLCYNCHRGPSGYHNSKKEWEEKYGPDYAMLDQVAGMLAK